VLSPHAVRKKINGLNFPSVVGKLKRLGGKPWCCLGTIAKRLIMSLWSQETWLFLNGRHRDILIVQRQPPICEVGAGLLC